MMLVFALAEAAPLASSFTFQGKITSDGAAYDGLADLDFGLWDAVIDGAQIGATIQLMDVPITEGLFTVDLDFGEDAFVGEQRWLELSINGSPLLPRRRS